MLLLWNKRSNASHQKPLLLIMQYKHLSDNEILHRYYATTDMQWLGILLERYSLLLLGVCMKYLKNEEWAKDAVQQVCLKALVELPKYKVDYFKSWIYMVAKNQCLMYLRNKKLPTQALEETHMYVADDSHALTQKKADEETLQQLQEAMTQLNAEQQRCVQLFFLEKKSYAEISELTGYPVPQVKSYLQNGKRNLKLLLEKKMQQNHV